jgi:hypothetical protein
MLHYHAGTPNSTLLDYLLGYSETSYNSSTRTPQKTRVTCLTASSLARYQHWEWRGRHRKHSLIYCCVLDRVYGDVAWQCVDQIHHTIKERIWKLHMLESKCGRPRWGPHFLQLTPLKCQASVSAIVSQ